MTSVDPVLLAAFETLQRDTRNIALDAAIRICTHYAAAGKDAAACGAGIREFKKMMNRREVAKLPDCDTSDPPFHPPA